MRFYPIGMELQLVSYQQGMFQVLDEATAQRGWIYERYYLQGARGPGRQMIAALQDPPIPKQMAIEVPKSDPHARRAKKLGPQPAKKIQSRITRIDHNRILLTRPSRNKYETVASIMERALRP